jgi:hypothetical protein
MEVVTLAVLISVFVVGFLIAGRWFTNVWMQIIVGAAMGVAIIAVLTFAFLGVMFAGCLLTGGKMDFK